MKRYWPVVLAVVMLASLAGFVIRSKGGSTRPSVEKSPLSLGTIIPRRTCSRLPNFLRKMGIPQPVMIDLSQKRFKGIALLYGPNFSRVLHPKQWEQYEHFSTYALDNWGNIYLVPIPFISIHPTTFTLQKKLFKLDTNTGKISIFMEIEDVRPSPRNPYGLSAVAWDCDDRTLWAASIDESDYTASRGAIYHIDPKTRTILQRIDGFDALTLRIVHTDRGKFLLAGSARDNGLYAFAFETHGLKPAWSKILEMPNPNEHIRKIRVPAQNRLTLETIPFSYSLIAQSDKQDRLHYDAAWSEKLHRWQITSQTSH